MLKTQQHARAAAASAQEAQFELEKVQETVRHGEDVRRLEHDMKKQLHLCMNFMEKEQLKIRQDMRKY